MFKNVLVPISSEFYSEKILKRSAFLAEKLQSKITFIYIIEDKKLDQTEKIYETYLSEHDLVETKKQIIKEQVKTADNIVFQQAKQYFNDKNIILNEKIKKGEFSEIIKEEINKSQYDLILTGYEKECLLNYRLLEEVDVPIWIESVSESRNILAICSNLAPNQKVPEISVRFAKLIGWDLHMIYVIDREDNVQVDVNGERGPRKSKDDLIAIAEEFQSDMKQKNIHVEIIKGNLEKETVKKAEEINANLVIVGREKKQKGILGLPVKNLKRKLADKCKYSLLFIK